MKEMREKLGSLDDPWSRPRKIRARIHRIDLVFPDGRQIGPTGIFEQSSCVARGRFQITTARHDDQQLRGPLQNVLPGNANRIGPYAPEFILPPAIRTISGTQWPL